ncbi:MAG: NAD(P)H-quinone oxidoreductase [Alphaproteobacteria bacterium]|nr:NAD(P)H-quinone oxidoreductase [Alphaproteobacteria bacterium]
MTVIAIDGKGGPEVLKAETVAVPAPGPEQVLIKVQAAGVNRPDVLQRKGFYPAPKGHSDIPGLEVAGTVAAIGAAVSTIQPGDAVMALVNGGGYSQYCLAEISSTLPIPTGLSIEHAAGVPETFFTVWHNVFERGALGKDDWFLVHGGTSGIGTTAIQLAKAFGAKVLTTAGSDAKCAACQTLGADRAINYRTEDFVDVVKQETGKRGVDVILDMVGGDYIARNIRALADDGRLVNIGYQSGSEVTVDMMRVMLKRLTLTGSTLRIRPNAVKGAIAAALKETVLPLLASGQVKVIVDSTFPLADAAKAHARMESSQHIGKIILTV